MHGKPLQQNTYSLQCLTQPLPHRNERTTHTYQSMQTPSIPKLFKTTACTPPYLQSNTHRHSTSHLRKPNIKKPKIIETMCCIANFQNIVLFGNNTHSSPGPRTNVMEHLPQNFAKTILHP